ncbi:hypothetical protein CCICO_03680 [Corynebacterium ciconiae DSM 44920]|uniref:DUF3040 domain-containing protein n=1 Tax=Corynebacterium ciconiae TaxID=227319 RepID=UPI0003686490|nr:DUF3040 domain-containing protein [Corynebacterium ciconiae]WKD60775.1 hypothetical protein CCICO_03680 [Corynebacterium ciconiae DSM 44920]
MSLSEQEQKLLREIEQSLLADDPKFGSSIEEESGFGGGSGALSLRGIAVGVIGLLVLVGGIALSQTNLWFIALSVVGFLIMFGAGLWMLRGGDDPTAAPAGPKLRTVGSSRPSAAPSRDSSSMEDRFRRRFGDR